MILRLNDFWANLCEFKGNNLNRKVLLDLFGGLMMRKMKKMRSIREAVASKLEAVTFLSISLKANLNFLTKLKTALNLVLP